MKLTENVTNTYDHYYLYEEITAQLKKYAEQYPQYCRLEVTGTTEEGRDILLIKMTDPETGDFEDKPGYYVEGNIHAGELTGSMVIMYFLDTFFTNIDSPEVQNILKKYTVYACPRVSPDGSEYVLTTPYTVRSVNTYYPYEEPMAGLQPEDIDKDGVIRKMRVKSPSGIWKISEDDPRVMVRRKPDDDEGTFYHVYSEGLIQDYDGMNIKEAPAKFGNDFNRNYPIGWEPEDSQRGAGNYPLSSVETKANAVYLMNHMNICSVVDMHTSGGQILYTPGFKSRSECDAQDIAIYKKLGSLANEESGYPVLNVHDEYCNPNDDVTYGGFDDFCHFILGIPALTIECWDLNRRAGTHEQYPPVRLSDEEQEEDMHKIIKWLDDNDCSSYFKPWTKFEHPQLGEVEIGGFDYKFICQNPPIPFLLQELKKHVNFYFREIRTLPLINMDQTTVEQIAEGVYKVDVIAANTGFMPTYVFKEGLKNRKLKPLTVTLEGAEIITGKKSQEIGHLAGHGCIRGMNNPRGPMEMPAEAMEKKVTWVVRAPAGTVLTITTAGGRIGSSSRTITL